MCGLRPRIERHCCNFEGTDLATLATSKLRSLNAAHEHFFYPKMHFFLKKFAHVHFLLYLCTLFRAFARKK